MRLLRATILPLLALLSLAALAWGVVSWWTFYRDLYVEEELALQALADEIGGVRYRRAGDFEPLGRSRDATTPGESRTIEVPWSVPYAGRIEYVDATAYGFHGAIAARPPSSPKVRDRILSLPSIRGFHDAVTSGVERPGIDPRDVPLGRTLPEPSAARLSGASLEEAIAGFPPGEEIDEQNRVSLSRAIANAWSAPPTDRPRIVRRLDAEESWPSRETQDALFLVDGTRRLQLELSDRSTVAIGGDWLANCVLIENGNLWASLVADDGKELRRFARSDLPEANFPEFWSPTAIGLPPELRGENEPREEALDRIVGASGERIVRIGRLDSNRLSVEALSREPTETGNRHHRFRAVVREDLDFAVERWDHATGFPEGDPTGPSLSPRHVEIRRLERIDGEPCIVESLCERTVDAYGPFGSSYRKERTRVRAAVEFDPVYSSEAFEPSSYISRLPKPRDFPVVRGYRIAWVAGGIGCLFASAGFLFRALHGRTTRASAASSAGRRFRLRFGLASVVAATLLVIGIAGWIKGRIDVAEEESILLRDLLDDHAVDFERAEPSLPWALFSTEPFPIGAPLKSIELFGEPSEEALERILDRSPPIRVAIDDYAFIGGSTPVLGVDALGRSLPEFGEADASVPDPIERGEPLSDNEAKHLFAEARAAWSETGAGRPRRFVLRVESTLREEGEAVAIRDGERFWILHGCQILTFDGRFHRRFAKGSEHDAWRFVGRQAADEPFALSDDDYPQPPAIRDEFDLDEPQAPVEFPVAPFALPNDLTSYWTRLERALERDDVTIAVETLDENRFLFEVVRNHDEGIDPVYARAIRWTLVARRDLDWCVEACDVVETYSREDGVWTNDLFANLRDPEDDRQEIVRSRTSLPILIDHDRAIRCRTTLRRVGDQVLPVEMRLALSDGPTDTELEQRRGSLRLALDVVPEIDERIFSRPTLDSPPPILPQEKSPFAWHVVAMLIGVAIFAVDPLRAMAKRLRRAESKNAATASDASGKDAA